MHVEPLSEISLHLANQVRDDLREASGFRRQIIGGEEVAEAYLADALSEASTATRCDLEPLSAVLKELGKLKEGVSQAKHTRVRVLNYTKDGEPWQPESCKAGSTARRWYNWRPAQTAP